MYFSDDGDLVAVRFDNWKVDGAACAWNARRMAEPFVALRLPKLFNLRMDPFERADITSNTYYQWLLESGYLVMAASVVVGEFMKTFGDFAPRAPFGELQHRPGRREADAEELTVARCRQAA